MKFLVTKTINTTVELPDDEIRMMAPGGRDLWHAANERAIAEGRAWVVVGRTIHELEATDGR